MVGQLEGVVCGNIGVGAVGSYWTRWQRKNGATVLVYDSDEATAQKVAEEYGCEVVGLDELIGSSDWISTAILPLTEVPNVMGQIKERKHLLKKGALLLDHSGVKTGPLNEQDETSITSMLNATEGRGDVEIIAPHLAFRPDVEFEGQNVYISPVRPVREGIWLTRINDMLTSEKAEVYQMTPEQQDMVTMRHQMIVWGSLFAALEAMRRSGSDMSFPEMEQLTTKLSEPFFGLMKRMVSGNSNVYWQTMLNHPQSVAALDLLGEGIKDLSDMLKTGTEASGTFGTMYEHLKAITQSGSPDKRVGKQIMIEVYYETENRERVQEVLDVENLEVRPYSSTISVSTVNDGLLGRLRDSEVTAASYTKYAFRDARVPEIAFYVRNTSHPEHTERRGMRFSPMIISPAETERQQELQPTYTRIQLERLEQDPIANFFMNMKKDPVLSGLGPFVVYNSLAPKPNKTS